MFSKRVVDLGLEEVDVHEQELIVQLLDLERQLSDELERVLEGLHVEIEAGEPQLHAVPQEGSLLCPGPRHLLLAQLHLEIVETRDSREDVDDVPDDLGRLCLGNRREQRPELGEQRLSAGAILELGVQLRQLIDRGLLRLDAVAVGPATPKITSRYVATASKGFESSISAPASTFFTSSSALAMLSPFTLTKDRNS